MPMLLLVGHSLISFLCYIHIHSPVFSYSPEPLKSFVVVIGEQMQGQKHVVFYNLPMDA